MSYSSSVPLTASFFKPLSKWKVNGKLEVTVGCDVGGSGFRLRLSSAADPTQHLDIPHFKAQTTTDCVAALRYVESLASKISPDFQIKASAMGVAGRLDQDNSKIVVTNWKGSPDNRTLSLVNLQTKLFPQGKSFILNDLEAAAYGMIDAQMKGKLTSFFEPLWPDKTPKEPIISKTRTMLIDAGTGLGIALIERTPLLKLPYVFATELGHLQTSINMMESPQHDSEFHLTQYISDMMYDGKQAPEFEDIASGRGIPVVYQYYYNQITGKKIPLNEINAEEIASHAKNGDRIAYKTMLTHHQFLMRAAKAVATSLSCENVLLALDNQVKNDWFVQREKDRLADEFFNFIRPDWMKKIHVYTQRKLQNFTLRGTVWLANTRLNKK